MNVQAETVGTNGVHIYAYAERISLRSGEDVRIMASVEGASKVEAQLVRLIHADCHPAGPGFIEEPVNHPANGALEVRRQPVQKGNFLRVVDADGILAPSEAFTLHAFIYPTAPGERTQSLLGRGSVASRSGYGLELDAAGRLAFWIGDGQQIERLTSPTCLLPNIWYLVAASYHPASGRAEIRQKAIIGRYNSLWSPIVPCDYDACGQAIFGIRPVRSATDALIGGRAEPEDDGRAAVTALYNGKIDRCGIQRGTFDDASFARLAEGLGPEAGGIIAYWDTAQGYTDAGIGDAVHDVGPHGLNARGVNRPVRGQTGWNWDGRSESFRLAPHQYGGIEFHDDALIDCAWEPTLTLCLPPDLRSGIYALRLTAASAGEPVIEHAVFCVRPPQPRAKLCFLVPTATYMAYANGPRSMEGDIGQALMGRSPVLARADIEACENDYLFGLSTYDTHRDGVGVCYSSYRRPIFTMRPTYRFPGIAAPWGLAADLSIIAWLEHQGYDYDVLTDEDLDREGLDALSPYRVVINGTHCEYYSERMLNATEDYLSAGGRLLYLSGNGYYWVVAFRPDEPWVMEVRRREGGSRAWQGRAGEGYLVTTGEPGGLWRHRNRAPQKLVGTGFAAEGMDVSVPYRRMPDSHSPEASWIFAGVEGEIVGDFGLVHGGAAGLEIDRYDPALGTPPNAYLLASTEPLTANWPLVQEEIMFSHPGLGGDEHPMVRCDMTYFKTRNDGAVFAASSIAWAGSLPWNGFDNSVSRTMKNVIDGFLGDRLPA